MRHKKYEAIISTNGKLEKSTDDIVIEGALQININDSPYTVVMRTPDEDFYLIRGLLYAEDIYKKKENPKFTIVEENNNGFSIINVTIATEDLGKGYLNKRTLLSVSSCGICGKQDLQSIKIQGDKITSKLEVNKINLKQKFNLLKEQQNLFSQTGGSHAAAIFGEKEKLIAISEDIGRHNAVDKVIGKLLTNKNNLKPTVLLVSGRVSYEIISKAFIARIPIVAAVSACSSLAIDYAKELGITLIGFSRGEKYTYYS